MAHVILHNRNTQEDFEFSVPTREAQALVDLAAGGMRPLSWAVKGMSHDVLVPKSLRMDGERMITAEDTESGAEWTVRGRYETTDGDRVTLLISPGEDRFAVSYSYAWGHAPQFIEYTARNRAFDTFVRSLNGAEVRGVVAHKEG